MQINRLFEIIYILLDQKNVTAKELAARFEVSTRTIYRDIDALSAAGIPVYASQGKGGGIRLLDGFVLDKSLLSEQEQNEILAGVQSLRAAKFPETVPVLEKLGTLFQKSGGKWIDVDFSHWGSGIEEREKFNLIKNAIFASKQMHFTYYGSNGKQSERTIEPFQIVFKGQAWYLRGFCLAKQAERIFKMRRIKNLIVLEAGFEPQSFAELFCEQEKNPPAALLPLTIELAPEMAFRVYDEFLQSDIVHKDDGSFLIHCVFSHDDWLYTYLMSFGTGLRVIDPPEVRERFCAILSEMLKNNMKKL